MRIEAGRRLLQDGCVLDTEYLPGGLGTFYYSVLLTRSGRWKVFDVAEGCGRQEPCQVIASPSSSKALTPG